MLSTWMLSSIATTTTTTTALPPSTPIHTKPTLLTKFSSLNPIPNQATATTTPPLLPIILILGPCASGKGTLSKRLAAEHNLCHLSVGDWLRAQAVAPIANVSDDINRYVAQNLPIPTELIEAEFGTLDSAPPALVLYQCSKLGMSTPESLKINAMPFLKAACEQISTQGKYQGILIDNLQQNLRHCDAAANAFGAEFPRLVISVDCADAIAKQRFLSRGRGEDDARRFERRIERFRVNYGEVVRYFESYRPAARVRTDGEAEEAYQSLVSGLKKCEAWLDMLE